MTPFGVWELLRRLVLLSTFLFSFSVNQIRCLGLGSWIYYCNFCTDNCLA